MNNYNLKSVKSVTYSGVLIGLNIVFLYLSSILPTGRLFLLCLTTLTIMILIVEFGTFYALAAYAATSILGLLIIPKPTTIAFVAMFGYYGVVKYYIEKLNNILLEYILKYSFFNIVFFILFKVVINFFMFEINFKYNIWYLIIIVEMVFLIYDYAMSLTANYYIYRIRNKVIK